MRNNKINEIDTIKYNIWKAYINLWKPINNSLQTTRNTNNHVFNENQPEQNIYFMAI